MIFEKLFESCYRIRKAISPGCGKAIPIKYWFELTFGKQDTPSKTKENSMLQKHFTTQSGEYDEIEV